MKPISGWEEVKPSTGANGIEPGGYVMKILAAQDIPEKQYLKIILDIDEGKNKGHYQDVYDSFGFWGLILYRSYKSGSEGMFKAFTNAVEASNNYVWAWNEATLKGLKIGAVLQTEKYKNSIGDIKNRIIVNKVCSVQDIYDGNFKIPAVKDSTGDTTQPQKAQRQSADPQLALEGFMQIPDAMQDEGLPFR